MNYFLGTKYLLFIALLFVLALSQEIRSQNRGEVMGMTKNNKTRSVR